MEGQRGFIEARCPTADEEIIEERLITYRKQVQADPNTAARECMRQLRRWLREERINEDTFIYWDCRANVYRLGRGWDRQHPVINDPHSRIEYWKNLDRKSGRKLSEGTVSDSENDRESDTSDEYDAEK
jgi:hypothetical protein